MKKELRPYQKELLSKILESKSKRLCVQLSTGGGKTVIFTELITQLNKKTLILVDSIDLVGQTIDTFKKQGVDVGTVLAGTKKIPDNLFIVAMVKSLWNRRKNIPDFELCIYDECHLWEGNKLFPYLKNAQIIGFTATPVRLNRYKINEFESVQETMADVYDELICGKPINWLMENNYLVPEKNEYIEFDSSGLKTDASGEFTASSMKEVFQSDEYKTALKKTFDKLCQGKKTMIFTSCTETNAIYAELFREYNVQTYDSVNNKSNERSEIVEWFRNTPDAVLINTGCFQKGFDVCDVEVILMARATKSLALWIQIAGRGARITIKIEKPNFLLIDGGNNNQEHQIFSFDRDWQKIFSDKKTKSILLDTQNCKFCDFIFDAKDKICPNCGEEVQVKESGEETIGEKQIFTIKGQKHEVPIPTIDLNFFINKGATKYEVLKVLKEKWLKFLKAKVFTIQSFDMHIQNKFNLLLRPIYFKILGSMLVDGKRVKYMTFCEQIIKKYKDEKYSS